MRVAALDLGTNTFLLLIAEVENGAVRKVLHDEVQVVRLGQGVHQSRTFHPDALLRAEACFEKFSKTIQELRPEQVRACATSAARDVTNGGELLALGRKYGIPIEIISGEREGELTYWGTVQDKLERPVVIVDVGGGSTEYIVGDSTGPQARRSLDIGSVRLSEMFVTRHPIPENEIRAMASYIQDQIKTAKSEQPKLNEIASSQNFDLVAVAGTPTTLATIDQGLPFESDRVDGYKISLGKAHEWIEKLASMSIQERQMLAGMEPKRADVIVAGSLILALSAEALGAKELIVSTRGLRYGLARSVSRSFQKELAK